MWTPASGFPFVNRAKLPSALMNTIVNEISAVAQMSGAALQTQVTDSGTQMRDAILANISGGGGSSGQCRLISTAVDGSSATLVPFNGNYIKISGMPRTIPAAGINFSPVGLTDNTLYFMYVYWNGTQIVPEFSTTGHATDAATGVEVKSGDSSRTLVGMCRPLGGKFVFTNQKRLFRGWHHEYSRSGLASLPMTTTTVTVPANTPQEYSSLLRCEFLSWAGERLILLSSGYVTSDNVMHWALEMNAISDPSQVPGYYVTGAGVSYGLSLNGVQNGLTVMISDGYYWASLAVKNLGASAAGATLGPGYTLSFQLTRS